MDLQSFLTILNDNVKELGLKIVVIRNYETLPKKNIGNDIDVIVNENDINLWLQVLSQVCTTHGLKLEITKRYYYCTKTVIYGVDDKFGKLELDLNNRFEWRGVKFYSTEHLINESTPYNKEIYTPSKELSAFITFCHSFLYGGFIQKKYSDEYELLTSKEGKVKFKNLTSSFMKLNDANRIISELEVGNYKLDRRKINVIRVNILIKLIMTNPINTIVGLIKSIYYDKFY